LPPIATVPKAEPAMHSVSNRLARLDHGEPWNSLTSAPVYVPMRVLNEAVTCSSAPSDAPSALADSG